MEITIPLHKADDNFLSLGYTCHRDFCCYAFPSIPRPGVTGRDNERTVPVRSATGTSPLGGAGAGAKRQETFLGHTYDVYDDDHGF